MDDRRQRIVFSSEEVRRPSAASAGRSRNAAALDALAGRL